MTYIPEHLKRWTLPGNYAGTHWDGYYSSGFGQHRDSDALERSNFLVAWEKISKASKRGETQVVNENHWAVGWVEWIAIHPDDTEALKVADTLREKYEQYPVLSNDHHSRLEDEEAQEVWAECYSPKERIAYIRKAIVGEFHFRSFADLLGCVRGKYFAGYSSELISR